MLKLFFSELPAKIGQPAESKRLTPASKLGGSGLKEVVQLRLGEAGARDLECRAVLGLLTAAEGMGFEPRECVVVEDSVTGIQAALDAGMSVVAYRQVQRVDSGVWHIEHHSELGEAIAQLNR